PSLCRPLPRRLCRSLPRRVLTAKLRCRRPPDFFPRNWLWKPSKMHEPLHDILYLVHRVPYPPDKGDRIRAFHVLNFLSRRGNVHLACRADEPVAGETIAALEQRCQRLEVIRLASAFRWLRAFGAWARGRTLTEGAFSCGKLRRTVRAWAGQTRFSAVLA